MAEENYGNFDAQFDAYKTVSNAFYSEGPTQFNPPQTAHVFAKQSKRDYTFLICSNLSNNETI